MPRLTDVVRNPFATLTSTFPPPKPGTRAYDAWNHLARANVAVYRWTGGRVGGSLDGAPVLLLHHVGRKSGERRVTPLLHLRDGDRLVIVASMGGIQKHPAWYLNLVADPNVSIQVRHEHLDCVARIADHAEKPRLWDVMQDLWPNFDVYQSRTTRDIPVVIIEPKGDG